MDSNQRNREISEFIRDKQKTALTVDSEWKSKVLLLKNEVTKRFDVLYMCESYNVFFDKDLKYAAIYDNEKDELFNMKWYFQNMIENTEFDIDIHEKNIASLKEDLLFEIEDNIQRYALENPHDFEIKALPVFQKKDPQYFSELKNDGISYFLTHDCSFLNEDSCLKNQLSITDGTNCNLSRLQVSPYWATDQVLLDYLNDKVSVIEQEIGKLLMNQDFRNRLGISILNSKFIADIVCMISENNNGEYDLQHKKKAMIKALEEKNAVNVNLTITYGNDSLEFKFSKSRLLSFLKQPDTNDIGDYGKAYDTVKAFLIEHKQGESSLHRYNFDFQNISRIMHSGKELYVDETLLSNTKNIRTRVQVKER